MLNMNGVMYKPSEAAESDKGGDSEDVRSVPSGSVSDKDFMYKAGETKKLSDILKNMTSGTAAAVAYDPFGANSVSTPGKGLGESGVDKAMYETPNYYQQLGCARENPLVVDDNAKSASSSEVPAHIFETPTDTPNGAQSVVVQDGAQNDSSNKEKEGGLGKRKRISNNKYGSPTFERQKPGKRQSKNTKGIYLVFIFIST